MLLIGTMQQEALSAELPIRVLVLSVSVGQSESPELRESLSQSLRERGHAPLNVSELSATERSCKEIEYLRTLGQGIGVAQIVGAQISEANRTAKVWLFTVSSGDSHKHKAELTETWARTLDLGLSVVLTKAGLRDASQLVPSVAVPPTGPGPGMPMGALGTEPTPLKKAVSLPAWRLGLGSALGALSAIGWAVAIGTTAKHGSEASGQCRMGIETDCRYSLTPVFAPAYVIAGLATLGAALTLAWPSSPRSKKESAR
jgi:hypothetical protein